MYQPVESNTAEQQEFERSMAWHFGTIRRDAIERKISPRAVHSFFDVGSLVGSILLGLRLREPAGYPEDLSMDSALADIGKYASENGVSPLEVIRFFEIGNSAVANLKHLKNEDFGPRILPASRA